MKYYCITYLYETDKTDCGVSPLYMHLPCTYQVTNDEETALQWFDAAVKSAVRSWNGGKLVSVEEHELDCYCYIRRAHFICNEAAYMKGNYLIELNVYEHNPLL